MLAASLTLHSGGSLSAVERPLRVVSLAPSTTEILFALGLDKEIVGVSQFCNYPPEAAAKARMGTFSSPSIEKILSLKPDMVFCTGLEQAPSIMKMEQLGLKICVSDPSSVEGLYESIREIALLVGRTHEGERLIADMGATIDKVRARAASIPPNEKKRVFVEIWHSPSMTAGKGSIVDELITLAGGENVAHDIDKPYAAVGAEEILRRDPDCIILAYMDEDANADAVRKRPGWGAIRAVRSGMIVNDIDPDTILRPGPRLAEGLARINKRLYPE